MQASLNWLTDPTVFQVNRLDAHSDHVCYASAGEAQEGETSLRQSLDGLWRFAWSKRPADRPADFWREDFDVSDFGTIQVPGHMETLGYGQIQYINTLYPWDGHSELRPPEIDWEDCPVGSYVRDFDLDPGLRGKKVCVSFQGAEQAIYVWLNGHFVGYAEDSFTPSEFDLTPYVRETGNRLCVEVYKRSSAAWIEDQDFFRFSGLFRSVYLYAKPQVHLSDLWLQAGLEEDNATGTLSVRLLLEGAGTVRMSLTHPAQGTLFDGELELTPEGKYLRSQPFRFENIRPWDHEHPELYRVTLTLTAPDGTVTEVVPYDIGFRRFELKDGLMLLNGERIVFNGVNRHEWNPETGRAIGLADMTAAMEVFKRSHINAVRTCHYPNQTPWYHLCDSHGIYMMDEANLESHGSWQKLGQVEWLGLSGETYPDRKRGGVFGWHRETPHIPAYLVPQECGCHVDTRAVILRRPCAAKLTLEMGDAPFAFSAIPYTPWQLEQAAHREELPATVRTVLTLCGAMRGVGGIDSWGADVEAPYRVKAERDVEFSIMIRLGCK